MKDVNLMGQIIVKASPLPLMLVLIWYRSSIPIIVLRCSTPYTTISI